MVLSPLMAPLMACSASLVLSEAFGSLFLHGSLRVFGSLLSPGTLEGVGCEEPVYRGYPLSVSTTRPALSSLNKSGSKGRCGVELNWLV